MESTARKLLPSAIDEIADQEPEAIYAEYPACPTSYDAGFESITYDQLARSIDCVAFWLESSLGRGRSCEPLAYLGPNDVRYVFTFVGAIKAGYKLLLTSPRNTVAAQVSLLEQLNCTTLIVTDPPLPIIADILRVKALKVLTIASQDELMSWSGRRYRYTRTWKKGRFDEVFVSHTSGSTGLPQARTYTNEFISKVARTTLIPPPPGYDSLQRMLGRNRSAVLLPLFHPGGVQFGLFNAVFNRTTVLFPLPAAPATIESLLGIAKNTKANWCIAAPFTLEPLAKDEALLDQVKEHLDFVVTGGGSLPRHLGDIIAKKIRLANYLGSSETAGYPFLFPRGFDPVQDWHYIQIHPAAGVQFQPRDEISSELVIKRSPAAEPYQPVFEVFPRIQEYCTKDMFVSHPKWPSMWTHASRSDDLIVFLNGLKFNPVEFESEVRKHPTVANALMFGSQRFEAGVLIELHDRQKLTPYERAQYISSIWPCIEAANELCPSFAAVSQTHVLLADPALPFQWTGKSSIKRQETLKQYTVLMERLYADVDQLSEDESTGPIQTIDISDRKAVLEVIQTAVTKTSAVESIEPDEDFFHRGLDSVHVLQITRRLRTVLGLPNIEPSTLYLNSSASALATAVGELSGNAELAKGRSYHRRKESMSNILQELYECVDTEAALISTSRTSLGQSPLQRAEKMSVVLTGSTGFIGCYILRALLESPKVSMVYCLNRSPESGHKQSTRNQQTDPELPTSFTAGRVRFAEADLSKPNLGLDAVLLASIRTDVSLIIHNAWPVDFNLSVLSFTKHLRGVVNLSSLAARCSHKARLLFLSSVAAVLNYIDTHESVPESLIIEPQAVPVAGYSQSKYIAEQLLSYIAPRFALDTRIARLGQICGAARSPGRWKATEWLPSLVISSRHLGIIPAALGDYDSAEQDVSWMPVDALADALLELGFQVGTSSQNDGGAEVFHLINPSPTSWSSLLPHIVDVLDALAAEAGPVPNGHATNGHANGDAPNGHAVTPATKSAGPAPMRVVSAREWFDGLRASAADVQHAGADAAAELAANPALKLLEFYRGAMAARRVPVWEMGRAQAASPALRGAQPVGAVEVRRWVADWCGAAR